MVIVTFELGLRSASADTVAVCEKGGGWREGRGGSGRSQNFERGGRKTIHQSHRHLSQMHTTYCKPFTRKKAAL